MEPTSKSPGISKFAKYRAEKKERITQMERKAARCDQLERLIHHVAAARGAHERPFTVFRRVLDWEGL